MAQPDEDFFHYSARWNELRRLATGDPEDDVFTDSLIALLEERDKELEFFLENRVASTDIVSASGGAADMQPIGVSGRWNDNGTGDATRSTTSFTTLLGPTYFAPWIAPISMTLTDVAVYLGATTTGALRLGLYAADGTGRLPGTLLTEFGNNASLSTGEVSFNSLSQSVTGGSQYWWAYQSTNNRTLGYILGTSAISVGTASAVSSSGSVILPSSTTTHASGFDATATNFAYNVATTMRFYYKATPA